MGRSIIVLSIDFLSEFFCLKQVFVLGLVNHKMVGLIYVVILKFKKNVVHLRSGLAWAQNPTTAYGLS